MRTLGKKLKQISPITWILIGLGLFFFIEKTAMHYGFQTSYFDLYFKDNSTWNITQGKGLYLSMDKKSFFAEHFYPYFYLLLVCMNLNIDNRDLFPCM